MYESIATVIEPTTLPLATIAGRIALAAVLGGLIGLEREWRNKPAGLRTHMLVSLTAAIFSILMLEIVANETFDQESVRSDPLRIIEAVTAGVAFLAAGAIIRSGADIKGLTNGAGLWLAGALGTAAGLGYGSIAILATLVGVLVIAVLRWCEPAINKNGKEADPPADK